jgi:hypothetical protein
VTSCLLWRQRSSSVRCPRLQCGPRQCLTRRQRSARRASIDVHFACRCPTISLTFTYNKLRQAEFKELHQKRTVTLNLSATNVNRNLWDLRGGLYDIFSFFDSQDEFSFAWKSDGLQKFLVLQFYEAMPRRVFEHCRELFLCLLVVWLDTVFMVALDNLLLNLTLIMLLNLINACY